MKLYYPDRGTVSARELLALAQDWMDCNGGPDVFEGGYPRDRWTAASLLQRAGLILVDYGDDA
jgi:hypothetical protein